MTAQAAPLGREIATLGSHIETEVTSAATLFVAKNYIIAISRITLRSPTARS